VRSPQKVGGRVFDRRGTPSSPREFSRGPAYVPGPKPSAGWANSGDAGWMPTGDVGGPFSSQFGSRKPERFIGSVPVPRAAAGYDPADVASPCDRCGAAAARYGAPPWCARCAGAPSPPEYFSGGHGGNGSSGRAEHLSGGREWEGPGAWLQRDAVYGAAWDERPRPWPAAYDPIRRTPIPDCYAYGGAPGCPRSALKDHFNSGDSSGAGGDNAGGDNAGGDNADGGSGGHSSLSAQVKFLRVIVIILLVAVAVLGAMTFAASRSTLVLGLPVAKITSTQPTQ
jgi:hypothetical protein